MKRVWWVVVWLWGVAVLGSAEDLGLALSPYFAFEGNDPYHGDSLEFSALASRYVSPGGHGYRNELKKRRELRTAMTNTTERLSALVTVSLSPGAKTIVLQYHRQDAHTLVLVYVADTREKRLINGVARDGVFDVYVQEADVSGREKTFPLTTITSGGSFRLALVNQRGRVTLTVNDTTVSFQTQDSPGVYLKFGDYLQAKDPVTDEQSPASRFARFYQDNGLTRDTVQFSGVRYEAN